MELEMKSWHAQYYIHFYGTHYLPVSFCKYFWLLLVAVLAFPLVFPVFIANRFIHKFSGEEDYIFPDWTGILYTALVGGIGIAIEDKTIHAKNFWYIYAEGTLWLWIVLIGIAIFVGICFLLCLIEDHYRQKRKSKRVDENGKPLPKKPNLLVEGIKAFFGKYCPKITWK
jgi:hypothetical protein